MLNIFFKDCFVASCLPAGRALLAMTFFILSSHDAHAGAAVAKQQQMKAMQQQAYQQAVEQAMIERQKAEVQAYQQAVAEYQAAQYQAAQIRAAQEYLQAQKIQIQVTRRIQQQVRAQQLDQLQMQMLQQVVQHQLVQQVAAQIQAKQVADVQEAMVAQAIQEAVVKLGMQAYINEAAQQQMTAQAVMASKQAVAVGQMQQFKTAQDFVKSPDIQTSIATKVDDFLNHSTTKISTDVFRQTVENILTRQIGQMLSQRGSVDVGAEIVDQAVNEAASMLGVQREYRAPQGGGPAPNEPVLGNTVQEIVDIEDVWKKLDNNSRAWRLLIDDQAKVMTVNEFIERYRKRKIRISKPPAHYAQMLDDMASQNPALLNNPFMGIIQILAVMEYDFDYGGDRDELARKLLGPMYESNKQRLSSSH